MGSGRAWLGGAMVVALATLFGAPAHAALPTAPKRDLAFLHVGSPSPATGIPRVVDHHGREVLLKGVNVDGIVDYWDADPKHPPAPTALKPPYTNDPAAYSNGRCPPNDPNVEGVMVCDFDFDEMRPLGYNVIRLNLSWSLLEPQPGKIDGQYVDRIAQIVGWAKRTGIYIVLDMHQDAWSKFIYTRGDPCAGEFQAIRGYDGAPLWASQHATPACALHGVRELDPAVAEAFQKFWADAPGPDALGLQEHYTNVLLALAQRFHDDPTVAGYELMNEPQPGYNAAPEESDATELFPYWGKAVNAVVAKVKNFRQLFFVEPNVERNVTDQSEVSSPWSAYSSYPNVVYAPHIYTGVFTADQEVASQRFQPSEGGYRSAIADAKALGLPLWVGEFGNNPQDDDTILRSHYTRQDKYLLGGALWLWKENATDINGSVFWGVYGKPFGRGTPQPKRILLTSRATPMDATGTIDSVHYGAGTDGEFDIRGNAKAVGCGKLAQATVLFVPRAVVAPIVAEGASVDVFNRAGAREVYVYPYGGPYRIHSGQAGDDTGPLCPPKTSAAPPIPLPKKCIATNRLVVHLRKPRHQRIVKVTAYIDGKRVLRRTGHSLKKIVLHNLPHGRKFKLKVVEVTNRDIRISRTRTYRGCGKAA